MENRHGYFVRPTKGQVQERYEEPELAILFSDLGVENEFDLKNAISGIFLNASAKRSYVFLNYHYKAYAALKKGLSYYMPVYGVKGGAAWVKRNTNYAALYMDKEEALLGKGFEERVFGTDYLTAEEAAELSDPLPRLRRIKKARYGIDEGREMQVCRAFEKLWEAQEKNPETRFLILMKDAEERSLSFLRMLYLLMPGRLRLQMGFETNAAWEDINAIQANHGLPIHVLTMEKSEYRELEQNFDFPVAVYDMEAPEKYTYNQDRLELLRQICGQMSQITSLCFDFAEANVIRRREELSSSFKFYQEIVCELFSQNLCWWRNEHLTSIEQIYTEYGRQSILMTEPALEREAVSSFYMEMMPEGNYADEMVEMLRNDAYPKRERYLNFLSEKLYFGRVIDAVGRLIYRMDQEKEDAVTKTVSDARVHEKEELQKQERRLTEEKNLAVEEMSRRRQQEKKAAVQKLTDDFTKEKEQLSGRLYNLEQDLSQERTANGVLKQKEQAYQKTQLELEKCRKELTASDDRIRKLEKENSQLERRADAGGWAEKEKTISELERQLADEKKKKRRCSEELGIVRRTKKIFLILMIVLGITTAIGAAGSAVLFMKFGKTAEERQALKEEIIKAEEENARIQSENESLKASEIQMQSEMQELKIQAEQAAQPETEPESETASQPETGQTEPETQMESYDLTTEEDGNTVILSDDGEALTWY